MLFFWCLVFLATHLRTVGDKLAESDIVYHAIPLENMLGPSIHFETGAYNFEIFWGKLQFYKKIEKLTIIEVLLHFSLKSLEHTILWLKMEHTFGWSIHLEVGAYISKVGWSYESSHLHGQDKLWTHSLFILRLIISNYLLIVSSYFWNVCSDRQMYAPAKCMLSFEPQNCMLQ